MSLGSAILSSIMQRIPIQGTSYNGIPVTVYSNPVGIPEDPANLPVDLLWQTQPHLRTVVDFLSRGVAKLAIHAYERDGDDRVRDRDSDLIRLMYRPNEFMTRYELIYDLVANLALYNEAYWFIKPSAKSEFEIHPFPPGWVSVEYDTYWQPSIYTITSPEGKAITIPSEKVLAFRGWNPNPSNVSSPVDSLRMLLEEQHHAKKHRLQVWRNNGRVGSYITRPADAPKWDKTQRQRFYKMYEAFVGDSGPKAGSTPLLEDGMDIKQTRFNSADEQWAESVKLSLETVAQVYQVNPTMVGILDNANYSNVREFNKMLYTMTLGPIIKMIEERMNTFFLPMLGEDPMEKFLEFNVNEQLKGSFEEQAQVANVAVGSPYMTVNEYRATNNLPAIEGGNDLIRPLNMGTSTDEETPSDDTEEDPTDVPPTEEDDNAVEEPSDGAKSMELNVIMDILGKHAQRVHRAFTAKNDVDVERFTRELTEDLGEKAGYFASGEIHKYNEILKQGLKDGAETVELPILASSTEGIRFED